VAAKDYSQVLCVAPDAAAEAIKNSYRTLARKDHPDANPGCGRGALQGD
jgi:curved DNA-binding protein CbpA